VEHGDGAEVAVGVDLHREVVVQHFGLVAKQHHDAFGKFYRIEFIKLVAALLLLLEEEEKGKEEEEKRCMTWKNVLIRDFYEFS
jgi:hypothetical protein